MDAQPDTQTPATLLSEPPMRLHHHAFVVKNQEVNRHFLEDILGIPLVATWCESNFFPDVGREVEFCHTFYEIGDGGALAFFQFADEEAWKNRALVIRMSFVVGSISRSRYPREPSTIWCVVPNRPKSR